MTAPNGDDRRLHNERLIYNYSRRLKLLEERRSKQGDSTDPAVEIEIDELRLNIATLEELLAPDVSPEVQAAIRRNEGDWAMLFAQFVRFGQRLTKVEERAQGLAEQDTRDAHWRLNVTGAIEHVAKEVVGNDAARKSGQLWNRRLLIGIALLVAADTGAIIWLIVTIRGLM